MVKLKNKEPRGKKMLRYLLSSALLVLILYFTMRLILKDVSLEELKNSLFEANPYWVAAGFGLIFVYIFCWSLILHLLIKSITPRPPSFLVGINAAFVGFYFNNITPSASGGQPVQMYYLHRCGIDASGSSLVFLLNTVFNNIVMIGISTLVLAFKYDFISENLYGMKYALIFGYILNGGLLVLNIFLIFYPLRLEKIVLSVVKWLGGKKLIKRPDQMRHKAEEFFNSYGNNSSTMTQSPIFLLKLLLLHLIQHCAYYLIPFTAAMALGAEKNILLPSFCLQAVLTLAVSGFPTPGAVGISEGGFVTVFSGLLPKGMLESTMILTRFINFYSVLIISAIVTILAFVIANKKRPTLYAKESDLAKIAASDSQKSE